LDWTLHLDTPWHTLQVTCKNNVKAYLEKIDSPKLRVISVVLRGVSSQKKICILLLDLIYPSIRAINAASYELLSQGIIAAGYQENNFQMDLILWRGPTKRFNPE
jgi:hypothetical protein